jgi:hypothetical protein
MLEQLEKPHADAVEAAEEAHRQLAAAAASLRDQVKAVDEKIAANIRQIEKVDPFAKESAHALQARVSNIAVRKALLEQLAGAEAQRDGAAGHLEDLRQSAASAPTGHGTEC